MVERKLYKTKLCVLYQRGHCPRQSCSFAHGDAELRRFSGSFNGRRDYRGSDLRDKLDRGRSPQRRYSPTRDARDRHAHHGYSPSTSVEKRSNRKRKKKQVLDGQSEFSGGLKISDGTEDRVKEVKITSSDSKDVYEEQLKQLQSDINLLDYRKGQLGIYLEERVQEVDSLNSRIQELEAQLYTEKEECKRLTSKIKKFVKTHNRHSRLQDELKRSQTRLQKLGGQLVSDTTRPGANEEDSNINIVSDEETTGNHVMSPLNELQNNASPSNKKPRINLDADDDSKPADLANGEGNLVETTKLEKHSRWDLSHAQLNNDRKAEVVNDGNNGLRSLANESKRKRRRNLSTSIASADKLKGLESGFVLPTTSMAAHAVDEVVETLEVEKKIEVVGTASSRVKKGTAYEFAGLRFPLPSRLPVLQNAYAQYEGDDGSVDVEGLEEEMGIVDIV